MHVIRKWSFRKDEVFGAIAEWYLSSLEKILPEVTTSLHFCCNRYKISLRTQIYNQRYPSNISLRQFEVKEQYKSPETDSFFTNAQSKANLFKFLWAYWSKPGQTARPLREMKLYLSGGFQDIKKIVLYQEGKSSSVPALESTEWRRYQSTTSSSLQRSTRRSRDLSLLVMTPV